MAKNLTTSALRRVALWSPQSSYDDADIIYSTDGFTLELERLRRGAAWLVLGRKGIGKSALIHKFQATYKKEILSRKKEFDPAILHSRLKYFDKSFSVANAAQAFKLDILLLAANELAFHSDDKELKRAATSIGAYYDKKWRKLASSAMSFRSLFAFLLSYVLPQSALDSLLSSSALFRDPAAVEAALTMTTNALRLVFQTIGESRPVFIIFDEIDLRLGQQKGSPLLVEYLDALKGLLAACSSFDDVRQLGIPIYPIVVLRSDIYAKVEGADHNKWQSSAARVTYKEQEVKEILRHRLGTELVKSGAASHTMDRSFDEVWSTYVDASKLLINNKTIVRGVFERSFLRPRDIVYFMKLLSTNCVKRPNAAKITPTDFNNSRADYARYFLGELKDELGYLYAFSDRLEEVFFDLFFPAVAGKVTFRNLVVPGQVRAEFERLKGSVQKGGGPGFEVEDLIDDLIERSVFGVQVRTTAGLKEVYEYSSDKSFRLKDAEAVCLHNAISDYFQARVK